MKKSLWLLSISILTCNIVVFTGIYVSPTVFFEGSVGDIISMLVLLINFFVKFGGLVILFCLSIFSFLQKDKVFIISYLIFNIVCIFIIMDVN